MKNDVVDNYIDYDWFTQKEFKCYICDKAFDIEIIDGTVHSDMTVDRVNSELQHIKNNCELCCLSCNRNKSNY